MRTRQRVPSPDEVAKAQKRVAKFEALRFELDLGDGVWRMVRIGNRVPLYNPVKPELSMLMFGVTPVVPSAYLPEIGGTFWITLDGLTAGKVTWMPSENQLYLVQQNRKWKDGTTCKFRCCTEEAGLWLHRELAKACGMRFREHDLGGRVVYTRDP